MGIDRCTSRCLIICPRLFETYFNEISPVLTDRRYFTLRPDSYMFTATCIARTVRLEYDKQQCNAIATCNTNCSASVIYPLFKLKGIMSTCADVCDKKGRCCRNWPMVPTTGHPASRLLKRVGQALSLLCRLLPIQQQFHVANTSTFRRLVTEGMDDATRYDSMAIDIPYPLHRYLSSFRVLLPGYYQ